MWFVFWRGDEKRLWNNVNKAQSIISKIYTLETYYHNLDLPMFLTLTGGPIVVFELGLLELLLLSPLRKSLSVSPENLVL